MKYKVRIEIEKKVIELLEVEVDGTSELSAKVKALELFDECKFDPADIYESEDISRRTVVETISDWNIDEADSK